MYLSKGILAKSIGLATAAMLLVGMSSAFAGPVTVIGSVGPTDGDAESNPITLRELHVLIMTGYARAKSHDGISTSRIELKIKNAAIPHDIGDICAVDRSMSKDVAGFNLYHSATCVRSLPAGTYILRAFHGHKNVTVKSIILEYVLIQNP